MKVQTSTELPLCTESALIMVMKGAELITLMHKYIYDAD